MINVLQWKRRCEEALELSGRKTLEDGGKITQYFGKGCATICEKAISSGSLNEVRKIGCVEEQKVTRTKLSKNIRRRKESAGNRKKHRTRKIA